MSDLTAVDCQTFAGGFAVGAVEAGFRILAKREEEAGAGVEIYQSNRHVLGEVPVQSSIPARWDPVKADLVFGNPPCSGFSNMTSGNRFATEDWKSSQNQCMTYLVEYAAKCDPSVVVFESVQAAFTKGREFLRVLRYRLEEATDQDWNLTHVLHRVQDLGGAQNRPRYFFVASKVPFGIDPGSLAPGETLWQRIGDLADKPLGSVDGHFVSKSPRATRLGALAALGSWEQGERSADAWKRSPEVHIDSVDRSWTGYSAVRLKADRPSRVIVGNSPVMYVHPTEPRVLSYREIARIMGLPDNWNLTGYTTTDHSSKLFGKGICVEAGRWISEAVAEALRGNPGEDPGEQIGVRERVIDTKKLIKQLPAADQLF